MTERITWTAPDGTFLDLTDESAGYRVLADGTRGLRSVTYGLSASRYAGMDGESVQAIWAEAGRPTLGLRVRADSTEDLRAKRRGLVRAMRPKPGPGVLTVSNETGESRSLACYCIEGTEGDESGASTLPGRWWKLLLHLYAPEPWWYGDTRSVTLGLGPSSVFFPIFPLALSASTVQGKFTVDLSDTDTDAFPVWTITGPGTALTLTNEATGKVIQVNASIGSGETVVIDTRPGQQSVRRGDGTNLMSAVASDPALWTLTDGANVITAGLTGATSESRIFGAWVPRYAGI